LAGQVFVFTGEMEGLPRSQAAALVRERGAEVGTGVTQKTTVLVKGRQGGGSKYQKALALGVRVITQKEFEEMVYGQG